MGVEHRKGDVVGIKINGKIVNSIILNDYMQDFEINPGDLYLGDLSADKGYIIYTWPPMMPHTLYDYFYVLIGDQKVYVEYNEIWS